MQRTSKLWGRRGLQTIFQCSDTFDTHSEAMHGVLTDVKKRSKTNFLPNFVSFGGHGRSPHEAKLKARLWDKNA